MAVTRTSRLLAPLTLSAALAAGAVTGVDYHNLPTRPVFPGPWDHYIKAPADKSFIAPAEIWKVEGDVTTPTSGASPNVGQNPGDESILIGAGGLLSLAFGENISGRVCFQVETVVDEPVLLLAFSESPFFVGKRTDATNDDEWDLPLDFHPGHSTGQMCVGDDFIRGGFKYLTLYIEGKPGLVAHGESGPDEVVAYDTDDVQKTLRAEAEEQRLRPANPSISFSRLWVNCTSFPSQSNGRAYSGYFYSSSDLLNRIWYAGAYTLQLSTIDPREGSALIPVNRFLDHNRSPPGSWYSNFTVSRGTTVTTDGAKRDRLVWPGDMSIAVPGIAVSTFDMLAVRNALDVIYERQYSDGRLPYAGPPLSYHDEFSDTYHLHTLLGTYDYVLYSNDTAWLQQKWPQYLRALRVSTSKVDSKNLMRVTSSYDWNRHGMGGHNLEATAILHAALKRSVDLASFMAPMASQVADGVQPADIQSWLALQRRLELGIAALYCPETGLYSDNLEERHCHGKDHIDPQDGNAWALLTGMVDAEPEKAFGVSEALRARWNKFGAPAPEFPNVMSPFASSFELQAHCAAYNHDAAVELMLLMWGYLLEGPGFTNSTLAEGFRTDGYVHYPAYPVPSRNSHAHGWSTGPTSTLINGILGIRLLKPGGAVWSTSPVLPEWLGWMRGGFAVEAGSFEVEVWRIRQEIGGSTARKGVVAVATGPPGTEGHVAFGGRSGPAARFNIAGGETRAFVHWDDARAEELDMTALDWVVRHDTQWFRRKLKYGDGRLVYDDSFVASQMEERAPGVVDFGALKRGYSLTETAKPLLVLVTDEVGAPARSQLARFYTSVVPVASIRGPSTANLALIGRPDLHATLTKLSLWDLTQYDRVVYLDADTLVLANLDHLFGLDASIDLAASPELGFPDCFNSGVLVLRPSAGLFAALAARAATEASFDGGDQGLLNAFFGDGPRGAPPTADDDDKPPGPATKDRRSASADSGVGLSETTTSSSSSAASAPAAYRDWFRLSFTYNLEMHRVYRMYAPAVRRYQDHVKVLHFIGKDKPWHFADGRVDTDGSAYGQIYAESVGKWWSTWKQASAALQRGSGCDVSGADERRGFLISGG